MNYESNHIRFRDRKNGPKEKESGRGRSIDNNNQYLRVISIRNVCHNFKIYIFNYVSMNTEYRILNTEGRILNIYIFFLFRSVDWMCYNLNSSISTFFHIVSYTVLDSENDSMDK